MKEYNPKSWVSLIFDTYSRMVFRTLLPLMSFIGGATALFVFLVVELFEIHYKGTMSFHSLLGVILGLFLVLRTNTAYDRWWEGRKLWGSLVNDTRQLAIKFDSFLPSEAKEDRAFFRTLIGNVPYAMKEHLRDSILVGEMDFTNEEQRAKIIKSPHRPNAIHQMLHQKATDLCRKGDLSEMQLLIVDKELKGFTDIIGACERIKTTPIPYSYSMFIKKFLFIYALTLPVSFAWDFGYWAVPIVMLAFYFLVSVELIAEEIEDPFGGDVNDLPLDSLSKKIRTNVYTLLKE
jgi:putative membrane protein